MKRTNLLLHLCSVALYLAGSDGAQAQSGEQYYINGIYNPTLADARKIALKPEPYDSILPAKPVDYRVLNMVGQVPIHLDSIEAAKLNIQLAQEKLYKGFIEGGFRPLHHPLGGGSTTTRPRSGRTMAIGLHYKHLSSNGGIDDRGPSRLQHQQHRCLL
jgi:hypothetical protein